MTIHAHSSDQQRRDEGKKAYRGLTVAAESFQRLAVAAEDPPATGLFFSDRFSSSGSCVSLLLVASVSHLRSQSSSGSEQRVWWSFGTHGVAEAAPQGEGFVWSFVDREGDGDEEFRRCTAAGMKTARGLGRTRKRCGRWLKTNYTAKEIRPARLPSFGIHRNARERSRGGLSVSDAAKRRCRRLQVAAGTQGGGAGMKLGLGFGGGDVRCMPAKKDGPGIGTREV